MIRVFTSKSQKSGEIGEKIAVKFLVKHGFEIVEQNHSHKLGEIDIVAQKQNVLYLVEVKTQKWDAYIRHTENITSKKLASLKVMAQIYVSQKKWKGDYRLVGCFVSIENALNQAHVQMIDLI